MQVKVLNLLQVVALGWLAFMLGGCYKNMVPDETDFFSNNMSYSRNTFPVNQGQANVYAFIFNADYSTQPLDFSIERVRHEDSSNAPELLKEITVKQWTKDYTGLEKTIAEIEAKRSEVKRPVLDIREHSGEIFFWNADTSQVKKGKYWFDIRVRNKGGEKVFKNMLLEVRMARPYDPFEFDDANGARKALDKGGITHPDVSGVVDRLNLNIPRDSVNVYFQKRGVRGNTLTFKFFDKDSLPIKFSKFNTTKWDSLKYRSGMLGQDVTFGFNRKMNADSTAVTYDITNPYPVLADVSGNTEKAYIKFEYNRVSFGRRYDASIGLNLAVYEPGEWDVIFKFKVSPKFEND
jgi:hypothetical protein